MNTAHYSPPWADTSIIGIAGSSGSGKTSLAVEIVASLNLPWVVILSMVGVSLPLPRKVAYAITDLRLPAFADFRPKDSFYRPLDPEQHERAFKNEYDFDSPEAIDFDVLVQRLSELKRG